MIDKILNNIKSSTEIPTSGLSYKLQAYLGDIYDTYNCPKEIVISAALNAAGVAAGKKITTYDGKFTNNLSLWYCAVAPSGSGKTEPLDIIFKPLQEIKKANYKAYRKELAQWNKQAKAQGKSPEGEQPRYDRILLNNSTAEARHNCLQAAEQGLCLFVDELRAFLSNLSR